MPPRSVEIVELERPLLLVLRVRKDRIDKKQREKSGFEVTSQKLMFKAKYSLSLQNLPLGNYFAFRFECEVLLTVHRISEL